MAMVVQSRNSLSSNFTMGGRGSFYEEKAFDISVLQAIRAARQLLGLMAWLTILNSSFLIAFEPCRKVNKF